MLQRRNWVPSVIAACALAMACVSMSHAQADGQGGAGPGSVAPLPYGHHVPPHYVNPRFSRHSYGYGHGHMHGYGYRHRVHRSPNYTYGKYLFHVKYRYPELDYGLRSTPSPYHGYYQPIIILPADPGPAVQPSEPRGADDSSFNQAPIPSPQLSERFLQLADAAPGVVVIRAGNPSAPAIDMEKRPMTGDGWDLLRKDEPTSAWRAFTIDAANDPHNSLPRFGYALAAAMRGDEETAVWSMRRAIRLDPSAIFSVDPDDELAAAITDLRRECASLIDSAETAADGHFMIASMSFLLGEFKSAEQSLADAVEAGDDSESARNLRAVIDAVYRETIRNRVATAAARVQ